MGLFDFVKDAGAKLWDSLKGDEGDRGSKVEEHLKKSGIPGAENVNVTVENGKAVISGGDGLTQVLKEKIQVAVGNVAGISSVENNIQATDSAQEATYYTVKSGDTLSAIAKHVYGNANKYNTIFDANKPMLTHPDKIYPGQVLIIPKL